MLTNEQWNLCECCGAVAQINIIAEVLVHARRYILCGTEIIPALR